jgi:lysophospholipid acyltransferase (LPLAT)-like uncharacterized protein
VNFKQLRRQVAARVLPPLVWSLILLIWKTCKVKPVIGQAHLQQLLESPEPFIPCYWHQQQIFCVRHLLDMANIHSQLKLGYLISPSADGDMATRMFGNQGVKIIRGSATRGGAQALRDIYVAIRQQKISPIVTPDGPTGPAYQCKPGVAMLARISQVPLLPLAYAGRRVLKLSSWDSFMLPLPFTTIVVGVGPALLVPKDASEEALTLACQQMDERLNSLVEQCQRAVDDT